MKSWYVAQTQPGKERLALFHLANQSFESFCPWSRRAKLVGKRHIYSLTPFFPSYIFVRFDQALERWRSINGTMGIRRLVSFGADPAPLASGIVERFRELTADDGALKFDETFTKGDRVRIAGGPFDALCGTLLTAEPRRRVTVLLELLSGPTRVELNRDCLIGAGAAGPA